ncbi:unnamed protein product, partial [Ixodes hexagonus]
ARQDAVRHVGDLGNAEADDRGDSQFVIFDRLLSLNGPNSIIGRSAIIHRREDDLGLGGTAESRETGRSASGQGKPGAPPERIRTAEAVLRRKLVHQRRLRTLHKTAMATAARENICQGGPCPYLSEEDIRLQERMRRRRCFADQELLQALAALSQPFPLPLFPTLPPPPEDLLRHHFRFLTCRPLPSIPETTTATSATTGALATPAAMTTSPVTSGLDPTNPFWWIPAAHRRVTGDSTLEPLVKEYGREVKCDEKELGKKKDRPDGCDTKPVLSFSVEAIMAIK